MSGDRLTVSIEMDQALAAVQCLDVHVLDAARSMLAAADQLDALNRELRCNPVDPQLSRQLVHALLPHGFYLSAETQLAHALGVEHFENAWTTDDYRVLCQHILKEGD